MTAPNTQTYHGRPVGGAGAGAGGPAVNGDLTDAIDPRTELIAAADCEAAVVKDDRKPPKEKSSTFPGP